jgi:hypothetical protein
MLFMLSPTNRLQVLASVEDNCKHLWGCAFCSIQVFVYRSTGSGSVEWSGNTECCVEHEESVVFVQVVLHKHFAPFVRTHRRDLVNVIFHSVFTEKRAIATNYVVMLFSSVHA